MAGGPNAWPSLGFRAARSAGRRLRDGLVARQLHSPGLRCGHSPRLLGLSHMDIGVDFHAGDALWLEAVLRYGDQRFTPSLQIGAHARLSDNVHIGCLANISIGDHLLCGSRVLISDHLHGRYDGDATCSDPATPPAQRTLFSPAPVCIGRNVWLGDGVAVLAGAVIGDGCVVGANAVVTGTLPSNTVAVGVPAKAIRRWQAASRTWLPLP